MSCSTQYLCLATVWLFLNSFPSNAQSQAATWGIFENHGEIGSNRISGSAGFDPKQRVYTVAGGGTNRLNTNDVLHFLWKKLSGDVSLAADIAFVGTSGGS